MGPNDLAADYGLPGVLTILRWNPLFKKVIKAAEEI